jgi:hypothetical protein
MMSSSCSLSPGFLLLGLFSWSCFVLSEFLSLSPSPEALFFEFSGGYFPGAIFLQSFSEVLVLESI